ncbi:hypothetical protein PVAND_006286 [Polypedilum vanderplanki]|uniref:Uncharacterized protein n=1 Tax=Polypedilum vanderplanki TaxID=319348 RepID=A0A9J6C362_POLVA|nr:hypothetical protein PVAND_006286 [Polypedilum vanderplanki]
MCKCCQLCLEDLYWQCCEEKYCYDESIANYDPADDEYCRSNGHIIENTENNNQPITVQPSRLQRNISMNSSKIHEDDVRREIATANVNLPPEIVQVFAKSQIFHDHKPLKTKVTSPPATFSIGAVKIEKKLDQISEEDSDKLMQRLEQDEKVTRQRGGVKRATSIPPKIIETPAISEENEDEIDTEVVLRPKQLERMKTTETTSSEEVWPTNPVNKRLQLDAPYFTQRPASENDIFTITTQKQERPTLPSVSSTSDVNFRFSMTPEVPSISFANLPKNYLDTPSIDKFKKQEPTLQEIQTAEIQKALIDFSMPRYYRKSDLIFNQRSFDAVGSSNTSIASAGSSSSSSNQHKKGTFEKNKRLKQFRAHLPPLMIHKDKGDKAEKEK